MGVLTRLKSHIQQRIGKRGRRLFSRAARSVGAAFGVQTSSTLNALPNDWTSGFSKSEETSMSQLTQKLKEGGTENQSSFSKLLGKMPELHLPGGYQFCGPGTKFDKRIASGQRGINMLDKACREHDRAYNSGNTEIMRKSDTILRKRANLIDQHTSWFDQPKLKAAAKFVSAGFTAKKFFEAGMDTVGEMSSRFKQLGVSIQSEIKRHSSQNEQANLTQDANHIHTQHISIGKQ